MQVLAVDVGGTKTLVARFEGEPGAWEEVAKRRFESGSHAGLEPILDAFLAVSPGPVEALGVGVAGPVEAGRCQTTNLPWALDASALAARLGLPTAALINDFEAVALGLDELGPESLLILAEGEPTAEGVQAVLGAGTGLGEALLVRGREGELPRVLPTEGGHTSFAPRDETEIALLRFMMRRHGRVSTERVVSGLGLVEIYDFLVREGLTFDTSVVRTRLEREDPGSVIGAAALEGDPACEAAVERFVSLYGAEAGDLALKSLPRGGLFVAGGIAPKLLPFFERGLFMEAFLDKGRLRSTLERIPVALVLEPEVGLWGARRAAVAAL